LEAEYHFILELLLQFEAVFQKIKFCVSEHAYPWYVTSPHLEVLLPLVETQQLISLCFCSLVNENLARTLS